MTALLLVAAVVTVGALVYGAAVVAERPEGPLSQVEPDGYAVPLPAGRPLVEADVARARFDTAVRGYRMTQVDAALRRTAYDLGYKEELIGVLQQEVRALREGRYQDADALRQTREAALGEPTSPAGGHWAGGPLPAGER